MAVTINADNGVVSGSAGLKQTADSTGVLALQTNGTTAVTVNTSQNVGIGTSSPTSILDVRTANDALANVQSTGTIQSAILNLVGRQSSVDNNWSIVSTGSGLSGAQLRFTRGGWTGTPSMLIDSSGNVQLSTAGTKILNSSGNPILQQTGSILQVATFQTGAVATGTGTIPIDDTIPQITEGTEFLTLAITPITATSKLVINVCIQLDKNNANTLTVALFQDSTANAIASQFYGALGSGVSMPMSFTHTMTSGTTSSTTFRVRAGSELAGTVTRNGRGGGRIDGGVAVSSITIYEVAT